MVSQLVAHNNPTKAARPNPIAPSIKGRLCLDAALCKTLGLAVLPPPASVAVKSAVGVTVVVPRVEFVEFPYGTVMYVVDFTIGGFVPELPEIMAVIVDDDCVTAVFVLMPERVTPDALKLIEGVEAGELAVVSAFVGTDDEELGFLSIPVDPTILVLEIEVEEDGPAGTVIGYVVDVDVPAALASGARPISSERMMKSSNISKAL
jgi:hypothetical protein